MGFRIFRSAYEIVLDIRFRNYMDFEYRMLDFRIIFTANRTFLN